MKSESTILGVIGVSVAGVVLLASAFSNNSETKENNNVVQPTSPEVSVSSLPSNSSSTSSPSSSFSPSPLPKKSSSLSVQDISKGEGMVIVDSWITNLYKEVNSDSYLFGNIFTKDGTVLEYQTNSDNTLGSLIFSVTSISSLKNVSQINWNNTDVYVKLSSESLDTARINSTNPNKNTLVWIKNVPNYTKFYNTYSILTNINQVYTSLKPGITPINKLKTTSNGTIITAELDTSKVVNKKILSVFGLTGKEKEKVQIQFEDNGNNQLSRIVVADAQGNPVQIYTSVKTDIMPDIPTNAEIL